MTITQPPAPHPHQLPPQPQPQPASVKSRPKIQVPDIIEDHIKSHDAAATVTHVKRYHRLHQLGKGGFAHVYAFQSLDSHNHYAIKVIPRESIVKETTKKKLLNEIHLHRSINHPSIVKFHRWFEDSKNVYLVLELCENQTMMELVKRRGRLTETETQFFLWQLINTLDYLHSHRVIHRDLKLGNIFLSDGLAIKLGDFGLATRMEENEWRKKTICGTPNYIAPEILDSADGHSYEVDVWSVGVIMYTLLFGVPPFETSSIKTTYKKIRNNDYQFPAFDSPLYSPVSLAAKSMIRDILQRDPKLRPTIAQLKSHAFFTQSPFPTDRLPNGTESLKQPLIYPHQCAREIAELMECDRREADAKKREMVENGDGGDGTERLRVKSSNTQSLPRALPAKEAKATTVSNTHNGKELRDPARPSCRSPSPPRTHGSPTVPRVSRLAPSSSSPATPRSVTARSTVMLIKRDSIMKERDEVVQRINERKKSQQQKQSVPAMPPAVPRLSRAVSATAANLQQATVTATHARSSTVAFTVNRPLLPIAPAPSLSPESSPLGWTDEPAQAVSIASITDSISPTNANTHTNSQSQPQAQSQSKFSGLPTQTELENQILVQQSKLRQQALARAKRDKESEQPQPTCKQMRITRAMSQAAKSLQPIEEKMPIKSHSPPAIVLTENTRTHTNTDYPSAAVEPKVIDTDTALTSDMQALTLASGVEAKQSQSASVSDAIEESFLATATTSPSDSSLPLPALFVAKWVDYSHKYGLGYLLSSGEAGVYFNDNTKALCHATNQCFDYIEKMDTVQRYSFADYPAELKKKVTLLSHFVKYLRAHKKSKSFAALPAQCHAVSGSEGVYVKKWVRSRHAMIIRLSNQSFQLAFNDNTELILCETSGGTQVHFKDRRNTRHSCLVEQMSLQPRGDWHKRFSYAKDIIGSLNKNGWKIHRIEGHEEGNAATSSDEPMGERRKVRKSQTTKC